MQNKRRAACACALLISIGAWAQADSPPQAGLTRAPAELGRPLSMDQAVELALERNLELRSLTAEIDAARARVRGASLPSQYNPEISAEAGPRWDRDIGIIPQYRLELSQVVEIAGQRGARIAAAEAALRATEARVGARRIELAAETRQLFGRVLAAEQRVRLAEEAETLSRDALRAVDERFRSGAASRMEVNTARVDVGRTTRDRALAGQARAVALSDLWLLLAVDASDGLVPAGTLAQVASQPGAPDLGALLNQATGRPDLRAAREELEEARAERRLADRLAVPNLRLGVGTANEERSQMLIGTVGMPLPVFNRNQAARGASAARVTQAERALEAVERRVRQEVRLALSRRAAAVAAAEAYAGAAAQALQENLRLGYEAYRSGKLDYLQLMLIRRETIEARRSQIDTLEELNNADAQLRRAVGSIQ